MPELLALHMDNKVGSTAQLEVHIPSANSSSASVTFWRMLEQLLCERIGQHDGMIDREWWSLAKHHAK